MTNNIPIECEASGEGFWSDYKGPVTGELVITHKIGVDYDWYEAELSLTEDWNPDDGLLYTDLGFLDSLHEALKKLGFKSYKELSFSEQGKQGDYWVDFDLTRRGRFAKEAMELGYDVWMQDVDVKSDKVLMPTSDE